MKVLFLCLFSLLLITATNGLYSIKFFSSVDQTVDYAIVINGIGTIYSIALTNSSTGWINFAAAPQDTLSVIILNDPDNPFALSYAIKSGPSGAGLLVYDSKVNVYTPVNACREASCTGSIQTVNFGSSTVNLYINETEFFSNFEGFTTFPVTPDDSIRIQFNYVEQLESPLYYIRTSSTSGSYWYYNAYGQQPQIANPLLSPFGGRLSPITQLQARLFAESFGPSTIWVPIRGPPF